MTDALKGVENRPGLAGKDREPEVAVFRRRLDVMEREALHSHAMPDELARALLMSSLDDCRRALDGKVVGATAQSVAEVLDRLSQALTHSELKAMRTKRRFSS